MKKVRLMLGMAAFAALALVSSCGDDDDDIGGGGSVPVADGFYITQVGVTPVSSSGLVAEVVEADGFATQSRDGYFANYVFLAAGNYNVVNVIDQEISQTLGGTAAATGTTGSDCDLHEYILVEEFAVDGAAFAVAEAGLYKVMLDTETKEIVLYRIESAQVIGSATEAGWSHSADLVIPASGAVSADGATFLLEDVTLRPGEYKIRFNCRWIVDRRIDPLASPGHEFNNGYVALTNYGGTFAALVPGGANFPIAVGEDGLYDVEAAWTPADGFEITVTKTAPLDPITFVPEDFQWSIVGDATSVGWPTDNSCGAVDEDIDLNYSGSAGGTYTWISNGAIPLVAGGFKFRTNHCWDYNKGFNDMTHSGDGAADFTASGDGNFVAAGPASYIITITTDDDGATWNVDFDKQ